MPELEPAYICPECGEPGIPSVFYSMCTDCANERRFGDDPWIQAQMPDIEPGRCLFSSPYLRGVILLALLCAAAVCCVGGAVGWAVWQLWH